MKKFTHGKNIDRVLMYNPDAVALWLFGNHNWQWIVAAWAIQDGTYRLHIRGKIPLYIASAAKAAGSAPVLICGSLYLLGDVFALWPELLENNL